MALPPTFAVDAPGLRGPAVFDQQWCDLAFVHWAVDPDVVAPMLPRGTRPDTLDGRTYVGLIPFRMARAGVGRDRPVPWLGDFLEWNVRVYSVDGQGRHGVVFRSLEATRLLTAAAARLYGFPYTWADMGESVDGAVRTWVTRRRLPPDGAASRLVIQVGGPVAEPTELDTFLTARWGAHSRLLGRTLWTPNSHGPWPLHEATLLSLDDGLLAAAGLPVPGPPDHVRFSPGVRTQFGLPRRVR